jgi:co-chaperonin GroES (HSP10)
MLMKSRRRVKVSVGEQCPKDGTFTLNIGDEIFDKFKMTNFTQDGVTYLLIDYRRVLSPFRL